MNTAVFRAWVLLFILLAPSTQASIPGAVPKGPDQALTPGSLCGHPTRYRFGQKIAYCTRNVSRETKEIVYANYDQKYQLKRNGFSRPQFKMDHFVPLCIGGSNEMDNLWPQHLSISAITDPIENLLCIHLQKNLIKQPDAIALIRRAKLDLNQAAGIQTSLEQRLPAELYRLFKSAGQSNARNSAFERFE